MKTLLWLRDDLRLADNPALAQACANGSTAIVFVLDEVSEGIRPLGGAVRWWLHHSLTALAASIEAAGGSLILRSGKATEILPDIAREIGADAVSWNRRYGGAERRIDAQLKTTLREADLQVQSFQANLLFEPWTVQTGSNTHYKVFTPFWRACLESAEPRLPIPQPESIDGIPAHSENLNDWQLLPRNPDWSGGLAEQWTPGEAGAQERLADFLDHHAENYAAGRDEPAIEATSRLSPHLRFGELSPFQVWAALREQHGIAVEDERIFRSEVGWREFCWHLLYHHPDLANTNYRRDFDAFEWQPASTAELAAWQHGNTGYPLVDAGMRQLWQTGWMHNRVRMVVASFLVKNLLIDWREGERWFWDTLVDADLASNPANWQWVAGSGADAAPYFRVFNPVTQSKKFDGDGSYLRRFVPELAGLSSKEIHEPWKIQPALDEAPLDYPEPLVELGASRQRALETYAQLRDGLAERNTG